MLAGGLTPENVARAIEVSEAVAVDVASGVEDHKGRKDPALVKKFVDEAKRVGGERIGGVGGYWAAMSGR
jgi:phosphoribosylanthranilate isomerase